jgi:hypothetical protein
LVFVYPVAVILPVTRRVLRAGYGREDIVRAVGTDLEREREELAFHFGYGREDIVRALGTDLEREREELAFHFGADPSPVERLARGTAGWSAWRPARAWWGSWTPGSPRERWWSAP